MNNTMKDTTIPELLERLEGHIEDDTWSSDVTDILKALADKVAALEQRQEAPIREEPGQWRIWEDSTPSNLIRTEQVYEHAKAAMDRCFYLNQRDEGKRHWCRKWEPAPAEPPPKQERAESPYIRDVGIYMPPPPQPAPTERQAKGDALAHLIRDSKNALAAYRYKEAFGWLYAAIPFLEQLAAGRASAQQQPQWHDAGREKPEDSEAVAVLLDYSGYGTGMVNATAWMARGSEWWTHHGNSVGATRTDRVRYWLPLPPQPGAATKEGA